MQRIRHIRLHFSHLRIAAVVLIALTTASASLAQPWAGKGRLQGKVTGPDGKPLQGVSVTITKDGVEGQGPESLTTDKKGRWSYLGLAGGMYTILLKYEGLMDSEGQVKANEYSPVPPIKVQMKELPKEVLEAQAADERADLLDQGNADMAAGNYAAAREAYEKVMAEVDESQHLSLLQGVARTYYEEGDVDKAIETLDKALVNAPDDEATLKLAINLLVAQGREAEAKPYMDRLPEGAGVDANTVLNLGIQRYNENDYPGALEYFDRAATENPNMVEVYYFRGLTHLGSENNEQAVADFKKALEIDPAYKADEISQFVEYLESQMQESSDSQE